MKKIIYIGYGITLIALFFYSYTQIDLSLTFSRIEVLRNLVKSFQYIGYFNRPLSAFLFILLLILLLNFYLGFLVLAYTKQISKRTLWKLVLLTAVVLAFSYNAFSYDLFNYMFDAKIITLYHQNPYIHKALDFPSDPMLSFMHWTHRVYPYGPVWLVLTVPLSYIGLNLFIPTFFLFKSVMAASFLGTTYYIGKILQKINPQHYSLGIIFFGLNPLVIIESLISAHLDIVMLFFAVWSLYKIINKKYVLSFILLAISIGIKFSTAALIPIFIVIFILQIKKKNINWQIIFFTSLMLMIIPVVYTSKLNNFQPWYLMEVLVLSAILAHRYFVFLPSVIISFFSLLTYAPFLYLGNWNPPVPQFLSNVYMTSYIISLFGVGAYYFFRKSAKRKAQISKLKFKA